MAWHTNHNILIQGIHTPLAQYYLPRMVAYGTEIIGGVSAGGGGETRDGIPTFDLVTEAKAQVGEITTSLIFVEPFNVLDAAFEAIAAGIKQLIIISAGVPPLDMVRLLCQAQQEDVQILGPGSSGLVIPGQLWLGTNFVNHFQPGEVALLSRFSSLSQEVAILLNQAGLGQSYVVDVGNADLPGSHFAQWLHYLDQDPHTKAIALLGRYGSQEEIDLIPLIRDHIETPVVTYLCGSHAPIQRSCHDAGTIIANQLSYCISDTYTPAEMHSAFKQEKLAFGRNIKEIPTLIKKALQPPRSRSRRPKNSSTTP
ncbi:succinyl-CoA synthetase subunit alpha [Picosynechococcus sp. PCC 7003]|uniref:succinate--CoA ligase subunit alpha n=1 Tax=Picosynechococcus sp. PCC 7003 TaxID=374981 RepID=UPI0008105239|nr:succinyl-CoA synthetase subunit alpha [Picosynechococcus sp. PCC 7003]ANV83824.1 succinyl-CoA synthetase subunit alpha [Picosynechococcus sp. PCC 7003]